MAKQFVSSKGETWEWDQTPEAVAAIAKLHERIQRQKMKEHDDKYNYDTSGK
tara:strand:+ start:101 stop:256 length:156 start_codon:yes stop_codon:yes gene_type:complete